MASALHETGWPIPAAQGHFVWIRPVARLSTEGMRRIVSVRPADQLAVQPGIIVDDLNRSAA